MSELLQLRQAIADQEFVTASAMMETMHRDGWSRNWNEEEAEAQRRAEALIIQIKELNP